MVVHTQTDRVRHAQNAMVEFLLVNHPLDCPVCDKGGECPLQDITFGWGLGRSRMIEPKRHFEGSRSRCPRWWPSIASAASSAIAARGFSQEIAEDAQLIFAGGARARTPTSAPTMGIPTSRTVQRQHRRAVPGRGADLAALPVPGPALGHRGRGRHLHPVPGPVQRHLHRPRRPRRTRAGPRPRRRRRRLAVRQGPVRVSVDPRRRADHDAACPRRRRAARGLGGSALPARPRPAGRGTRAGIGTAGRRTGVQRGGLPAPAPACARRSGALRTIWTPPRPRAPAIPRPDHAPRSPRPLAAPALQATVPDLEFAHTVLLVGCRPASTTRRSSICGSARECAATRRQAGRSPARGPARWTRTPPSSPATPRAPTSSSSPRCTARLDGGNSDGSSREDDRCCPGRSSCATAARTWSSSTASGSAPGAAPAYCVWIAEWLEPRRLTPARRNTARISPLGANGRGLREAGGVLLTPAATPGLRWLLGAGWPWRAAARADRARQRAADGEADRALATCSRHSTRSATSPIASPSWERGAALAPPSSSPTPRC